MIHRIFVFLMTATMALIGPQRPAFDVASIRPTANGGVKAPSATTVNPNGITFLNVTTLDCITVAYRIKDYQVTGPDWMKSDRYDIVAKATGTVSDSEVRLMLQTLLAERFKLE